MAQTMSKQERAEALAATAHSWPHVTVRGMRQAWAVPSQSMSGKFHITTRNSCDCQAFTHGRRCVHLDAVALLAHPKPQPAVVDLAAERAARQQQQAERYQQIWGAA